jgi:hypothetical protein
MKLKNEIESWRQWGGDVWSTICDFGGENYADSINADFDKIARKIDRVIAIAKMKLGQ